MEKRTIEEGFVFDENRFTKIDVFKNKNSVAFVLNFLPGQEMKQHTHPNRELYLHVLNGTGTLLIDEERIKVREGDLFFCEADENLGFVNDSAKNVSIFATMTKIAK